MRIVNPEQSATPSLAWLLISAAGSAIATIVVAGVIAGRLGLPIAGAWLLGAGAIGALPRLITIARCGWAARWAELAAALIGFAAVGGVGLALAWPALLPLGFSVDAVHHTQLIGWMADHRALPSPGGATQGLLGEMAAYPVGLALLVLAASSGTGRPVLEATYPSVAVLGGLIAATVVVLSSAAAGELKIENEKLKTDPSKHTMLNAQCSMLNFFSLLIGPLLLLAHRTYLMEAYVDHSYYTMVLGVLLVLLAAAWLIVETPRSPGAAAQFGLALAALMCTYPLWAPLPAALAAIALVAPRYEASRHSHQGAKTPRIENVWTLVTWCLGGKTLPSLLIALGPALALLDVLPRMRIGQAVLAHEGLVALPNLQRLTPILLALPCAALLMRARAGRGLAGLAALVLLAIGALALAARGGIAAGYHSFKLLFVLTPLAAAIVGAATARLARRPMSASGDTNREARKEPKGIVFGVPFPAGTSMLAPSRGGLALARPSVYSFIFQPTIDDRRRTIVAPSIVYRLSSHSAYDLRWPLLGVLALILALTGSFQIVPAPAAQVVTPDMVAATRWLRANAPRDAARALAVGMPAGPASYWLEVGLLGQSRDKAAAAQRDFTVAPPSHASWLIDPQLASVAITTAADQRLPGETILARFGDVAVVRRAAKLDTAPLNPLLIRYRSFWEDGRLKTAIELQRVLPGPLPLLELRLYHAGAPIAAFALPPEQDRTRPQYLGADLLPATLGAKGYVNQSAYPTFDPPAVAPTGALSLTLRLMLAGAAVEERQLASFERAANGRVAGLTPSSGELIYLRRQPETGDMGAADLDFGALRLTGWAAPARAAAGDAIATGLRWQAPRTPDRSLFPELLLLNAAGQPVAASLSAPQNGLYPTWRWRPGERVVERRDLQLPPDLAPGVYQLALRVRDFAAGRALDVPGGADGLARIGEIVIEKT